MDTIGVRRAEPGDTARIAALAAQLGYPVSATDALEGLPRSRVFVATADRRVVGWIQLEVQHTLLAPGLRGLVTALVVDSDWRRRGVGRRLLNEARRWARAQGLVALRVRTRTDREDALAFYLAMGFEEKKTQRVLDLAL